MNDQNDHIADRAGFLAALSQDDPERKAADEHARSCVPCRQALEEGTRFMGLLRRPSRAPIRRAVVRRQQTVMPRQQTAMRRWQTVIPRRQTVFRNRRVPSRNDASRRFALTTVGAVVVAWLFRPWAADSKWIANVWWCRSDVLAVAIASVTVMRGKEPLAVATVVVTSGLFAYLSGTAAGLAPGIGIRCTFRELWAAAITWAIVTYRTASASRSTAGTSRRSRPPGRWRRTPGNTSPAPSRIRTRTCWCSTSAVSCWPPFSPRWARAAPRSRRPDRRRALRFSSAGRRRAASLFAAVRRRAKHEREPPPVSCRAPARSARTSALRDSEGGEPPVATPAGGSIAGHGLDLVLGVRSSGLTSTGDCGSACSSSASPTWSGNR